MQHGGCIATGVRLPLQVSFKAYMVSSHVSIKVPSAHVGSCALKSNIRVFSLRSDSFSLYKADKSQVVRERTPGDGTTKDNFLAFSLSGTNRNMLGSEENGKRTPRRNEDITQKLRRYGIAGVLSYGLLNTLYYLGMFLFVWLYVAPSPGGLGYRGAAERFIKILALVWAGSQITKLPRAGCALALAPVMDIWLTMFTNLFKFESRDKAFWALVITCFGLALVVFVAVTSLWA
eukprot:c13289_g1_i1 orf=243-941(-)